MEYTEQDCIDSLNKAVEVLGHSPSWSEYQSLDIGGPSRGTIQNYFGSWNSAKDAANIARVDRNKPIQPPPENMRISQEKWGSMTPNRRYKLRRRARWARYKVRMGCQECGYSEHPSALDFHHTNPDEKEGRISEMLNTASPEKTREEVEKCVVLCANCHRKKKNTYLNG